MKLLTIYLSAFFIGEAYTFGKHSVIDNNHMEHIHNHYRTQRITPTQGII